MTFPAGAHQVFDMDFDEISTVDVPANQHGLFVLAKSATTEETAVEYFDAEGQQVDIDDLEVGDVVSDAEGNQFEVGLEDQPTEEPVAKSAFLNADDGVDAVYRTLQSELAKAATDEQREHVLAKAYAAQGEELAKAQRRADAAYTIAKEARDRDLERQYIAKAAEYVLPIAPEELGPVMKRCEEALSPQDCAVLHKAFSGSSDIFAEVGFTTDTGGVDPFDEVNAFLDEEAEKIAKSGGARAEISKEQAMVSYFETHPEAYAALRRG